MLAVEAAVAAAAAAASRAVEDEAGGRRGENRYTGRLEVSAGFVAAVELCVVVDGP
jgi:hypothetical protein